jgi:hypothetical protein
MLNRKGNLDVDFFYVMPVRYVYYEMLTFHHGTPSIANSNQRDKFPSRCC